MVLLILVFLDWEGGFGVGIRQVFNWFVFWADFPCLGVEFSGLLGLGFDFGFCLLRAEIFWFDVLLNLLF